MSATSKFLLYNDALTICGEKILSSVSEAREARYVLDQAWDAGAVDYCLEAGQWNFAMRSIMLAYSPSVEPDFGYRRAFDKPTDWIRTCGLCSDEFFKEPLLNYTDEAGFWFAELDTIYVRYVSNDDAYGNSFSLWPKTFAKYVASFLASEIVTKLSQDETKWAKVEKQMHKRLVDAKSKDAMNGATSFPPRGSWTRSRLGRGRGDRGNRGNLIG